LTCFGVADYYLAGVLLGHATHSLCHTAYDCWLRTVLCVFNLCKTLWDGPLSIVMPSRVSGEVLEAISQLIGFCDVEEVNQRAFRRQELCVDSL